jgi:hypothetical protein
VGGPFGTFVMALDPLHVWLELVNSDDQGAKFELKVEMFKNDLAQAVAEGRLRCIAGLARDPRRAGEVVLSPVLTSPQLFNGTTDVLRVNSLRGWGRTTTIRRAPARARAVGLRAYFDAVSHDARFAAELDPGLRLAGRITADIARTFRPSGETPRGTSSPTRC